MSIHRIRLTLGLVVVLIASLSLSVLAVSPAQANGLRAGFTLPAGNISTWIGSYNVSGDIAFCGDPDKRWPGGTTYGAVKTTKRWKDSISGVTRSAHDTARVAWILHEYRDRLDNRRIAAAVDAAIYAILSKGAYRPGKARFNSRVNATGHGTAITNRVKKMLADSNKFAGPYNTAMAWNKNSVLPGESFTVRLTLTSNHSGAAITGERVSFTYKGVTKRADTNNNGVARVSFRAESGKRQVKASIAGLPVDYISFRSPKDSAHQRVIVPTVAAFAVGDQLSIDFANPRVELTTEANLSSVALSYGESVKLNDMVSLTTTDGGYSNTLTASLYGPFETAPNASQCTAANRAGRVTMPVTSSGGTSVFTTPTIEVDEPGYYTWVVSVPSVGHFNAASHPCGMARETTYVGNVRSVPQIETATSESLVGVGSEIYDRVEISGISFPCIDPRNGDPVSNPDELDCHDIELAAEVPTVPAVTAVWIADADGNGTPGCYAPAFAENYDPADYPIVPQVSVAEVGEDPDLVDGPTYWAGASADECEAVILVPEVPGTPAVTADVAPDFNVTGQARLYGPYETLDDATCFGEPYGEVDFDVSGNGSYLTPAITVGEPGVFTWVIEVGGNRYVEETVTECGIPAETTHVKNQVEVSTQTSEFIVEPGTDVFDTVKISNTGGVYAEEVINELHGPFESRDAINCTGEPFATVTFFAAGDGEYVTEAVTLEDYGYYTWVQRLPDNESNLGLVTPCGIEEETTLVQSHPELDTQTSQARATVGDELFDTLNVSGIVGDFYEDTEFHLYGPFASRADIDCSVEPYGSAAVTVTGDGEFTTEPITVDEPGIYTWHGEFAGNEINAGFTHDCGIKAETSVVKREKQPIIKVPSGFDGLLSWLRL